MPDYWDWDFGDGGSSTEQNPSHFYPAPTAYTVCLTAGNVAGESFSCKLVSFNSITDLNTLTFSITPNPANAAITISTGIESNAVLLNHLGQKLQELNIVQSATIDISMYPEGLYFIQINTDDASGIKPFVIQH